MYKKLKNEKILDSVTGGLYTPTEKNEKNNFPMQNAMIIKKKILNNLRQQKKIDEFNA